MASQTKDPILQGIPSALLAGLSESSPFYHDRIVDGLLKFRRNLQKAAASNRIGVNTEAAQRRLDEVEEIIGNYIDAYSLVRDDDPRKETAQAA